MYFAIDKFPAYGGCRNLTVRELQREPVAHVGGRVRKEAPATLYCGSRCDLKMRSVRPGCPFGRVDRLAPSALPWPLHLVKEKLGVDVLDIHAGGVDLIFPHHEDEIARVARILAATVRSYGCTANPDDVRAPR